MSYVMLTEAEKAKLVAECRQLPAAKGNYLEDDSICNCMLAVLDFQMRGNIVGKAMEYFRQEAKTKLGMESLAALNAYLEQESSDDKAAMSLWRMHHWRRVGLLRGLVRIFLEYKVAKGFTDDLRAIRDWAYHVDFEKDFQGRVRSGRWGLGFKVFKFTQQRLGVDTAVPDIWTTHFIERVTGKKLSDRCAVDILNEIADRMGTSRTLLDWAIWEYEQNLP